MRVLDELRKTAEWMTDSDGIDSCVVRIRNLDAFEAAHPGLVDLSGTLAGCVLCGAVSHYCVVQSRINLHAPEALLEVVCPACAKVTP